MKVWKVLWYGNSVYTNIETQQNLQSFGKNASQVTQNFFGILFLPGHAYREVFSFLDFHEKRAGLQIFLIKREGLVK